jgi:hypothetical protein
VWFFYLSSFILYCDSLYDLNFKFNYVRVDSAWSIWSSELIINPDTWFSSNIFLRSFLSLPNLIRLECDSMNYQRIKLKKKFEEWNEKTMSLDRPSLTRINLLNSWFELWHNYNELIRFYHVSLSLLLPSFLPNWSFIDLG